MSAEKLILVLSLALTLLNASELKVINTFGSDTPFRALLIEKSLQQGNLNCVVTQDKFENAVKKLLDSTADAVLLKDDGRLLKTLPRELEYRKFAQTRLLVLVNKSNPMAKIKLSDLRKIWNGDIEHWSYFNGANIFSIHRFGMLLDSGEYEYIKRSLELREKASHFPLGDGGQLMTMVSGNPNSIAIAAYEEGLTFDKVKIVELLDDDGKIVIWTIPHYVIYRKSARSKIEQFFGKSGVLK